MLESGIRYHGTVQRYAGSTVLVATTDLSVSSGSGEDRSVERYPLPERARVDTSLVNRIAQLPGVRLAAADVAAPGQLAIGAGSPGYAVSTHPWSAAALTPFTLQAGGAPTTNGEAVVDAQLAATAKVRLGQQIRIAAASGHADIQGQWHRGGYWTRRGPEHGLPRRFRGRGVGRSSWLG